MKKILFITLSIIFSIGLSAQKDVRKALRSGNNAYKEQLYGTAEAEYNKALEKNASSKEASFNLANTYYRQQKWDDAIKEYQHFLTLENEDPKKMSSAWSNMGNTFLKKKANQKNEMQGMMQAQAGQNPQDGQQNAAPKEDPLQLSMEAYKNALRLNPEDDETRYNLAVVQKMLKDKEDQNKDNKQDNKQDQKDDQKKDQNQDQKQDPKKDDKQEQKQDQQQQQNQMSQENMEQMLQAIEQDEKETQDKVNKAKAQERKKKNENNRKQNKDW